MVRESDINSANIDDREEAPKDLRWLPADSASSGDASQTAPSSVNGKNRLAHSKSANVLRRAMSIEVQRNGTLAPGFRRRSA